MISARTHSWVEFKTYADFTKTTRIVTNLTSSFEFKFHGPHLSFKDEQQAHKKREWIIFYDIFISKAFNLHLQPSSHSRSVVKSRYNCLCEWWGSVLWLFESFFLFFKIKQIILKIVLLFFSTHTFLSLCYCSCCLIIKWWGDRKNVLSLFDSHKMRLRDIKIYMSFFWYDFLYLFYFFRIFSVSFWLFYVFLNIRESTTFTTTA